MAGYDLKVAYTVSVRKSPFDSNNNRHTFILGWYLSQRLMIILKLILIHRRPYPRYPIMRRVRWSAH